MTDPLGLITSAAQHRELSLQNRPGPQTQGPSFKQLLNEELQTVNQLQQDAKEALEDFTTGRRDDLETVITATEKADVAFRMLLQVRNKVMDALDEVKQIRV